MTVLNITDDIWQNETERKPNMYAARVLAGVVIVIAIVWALNKAGIFTLNQTLMDTCLTATLIQFTVMQFIVRRENWITRHAVKYLFIGMVLMLTLILNVLLNIHAVLSYVLPILLATQYRSYKVSAIALVGAVVCSGLAPILSYFLHTWNLVFMTGYIQTFCRITIEATEGNAISDIEAVRQITLYWSMPQMLTLCAFGIILYSVTRTGISGVNNQIQVIDLSNDLKKNMQSIQSMQEKVLFAMSDIIESRDIETGGHVRRTSEVVRLLTNELQRDPRRGLSEIFCADVIKCAAMHDVGKISVPDTILRKPGKLTSEEYEIVKQHSPKSSEIIERALTGIEDEQLISIATNIARYHHERYDGKGYPDGLSGEDIPLEARIMAIADVYDALVSERCYKAPMSFGEAFSAIEASMGTQFDPALNEYFVKCRHQIESFYSDNTNQD